MQILLEFLFVFILCASCGWLLEVCYRSICLRRLVNPGFLTGCCLPIYGFGGMALYLLAELMESLPVKNGFLRLLVIFLLSVVVMTAIEFAAGYLSLKFYHNRLWDYSHRFGNVMGIVCPLFSAIWGGISVLFYYLVFPHMAPLARQASEKTWLVLLIGIYLGVFAVDLVASLNVMETVRKYAISVRQNVNFEKFKLQARDEWRHGHKKVELWLAFRQRGTLIKHIETLYRQLRERLERENSDEDAHSDS